MGVPNFGFRAGDALLVTGAGSGIGRAVARRGAEMGLAISGWDINPAGLEQTESAITAAGGRFHTWVGDVTDADVAHAGIADATATLGPITMLHNNAGPPSSAQMSFDDALVACIGSVRTMTDAWAAANPGDGAAMVVTSSVAGNLVGTDNNWYSASKAALAGYVRHLAAHRAGEFRSNAVAPGMTDTPRLAGFAASEMGQHVLSKVPLKRMASPDDIAYATLFLISPVASYINGVFLPVDGGWTVAQ
ncbi:SDR family NAD(P)-dependent oxidoreductase [Salinibacterium sp. ZJ70]|uniref:SDR family NAD(P)-dependent oxidoreductase n=1 Tax=Salinibacterium sp. ZJ70 TaxID=2708084 RepID=UPI0014228C7C|nr:SDR family oxidoreductase [Salinibacterium sp. ZJ70]